MAEIFFFKGNIARARYRQLTGDDAVFQLFQSPVEGEFSFTGRDGAGGRGAERDHDAGHLAAHGVGAAPGRAAHAEGAGARLRRRVFRQKAAHLAWEEAETVELAAAVWSRLKKGASLADLQRDVPRSSHAIYRTVVRSSRAGRSSSVPASDPGGLADLLPEARALGPSLARALARSAVIALRLARKDQFAASRSEARDDRDADRVREEAARQGAPFMPTW